MFKLFEKLANRLNKNTPEEFGVSYSPPEKSRVYTLKEFLVVLRNGEKITVFSHCFDVQYGKKQDVMFWLVDKHGFRDIGVAYFRLDDVHYILDEGMREAYTVNEKDEENAG